jgi:hypothetical protein
MKIVKVDNFGRDSVSDVLVADHVPKYYAIHIALSLNEKFGGDTSPSHFTVAEDDYKLHIWEP